MTTHAVKQKWLQNFRGNYDYLVKSDNEVHFDRTPRDLSHRYTEDAVRNALSLFYAIVPERGHRMGEHDNYAVSTESSEQAAHDVPPRAYEYLADVPSGDSGSEDVDVDDHSETQFASIADVLLDVVNSDEYDNNLAKTLEILETKAQGNGLFEYEVFSKIFSDRRRSSDNVRGRSPDNVDWAFFNIWKKNTPGGLRISSHFLRERVERSLENSDRPAGLVNQLWKFATKMTEKDSTLNEVLDNKTDFRDFVYGDLEKRRYDRDQEAPLKLQEVGAGFNEVDVNDDNSERTEGVIKPLKNFTNISVDPGMQEATPPNVFDDFFDFGHGRANTFAKYDTPPDIHSSLESTSTEHENINENVVVPTFTRNESNVPDAGSSGNIANINNLETRKLVSFGNSAFKPISNSSSGNNSVKGNKETENGADPADSGRSSGNSNDTDNGNRNNNKSPFSPLVGPRYDFDIPSEHDNGVQDRKNAVVGNNQTIGAPGTRGMSRTNTPQPRRTPDKDGVYPPFSERTQDRILRTPTPINTSNKRGGSRRLRGSAGAAVHTLRHQKWNKENTKGKK